VAPPGNLTPAPAKSQSAETEFEPSNSSQFSSHGDGMAAAITAVLSGIGREAASAEPIGLGATSPPAQVSLLLDAEESLGARLVPGHLAAAEANAGASAGPHRAVGDSGSRPSSVMIGRPASEPITGDSAGPRGTKLDELPQPESDDLIAHLFPFDRATIAVAIDRFFQQLEDFGAGDLAEPGLAHLVLLSAALASTLTALEVVRRRRRRVAVSLGRAGEFACGSDHIGFPELPGSWSSRLS